MKQIKPLSRSLCLIVSLLVLPTANPDEREVTKSGMFVPVDTSVLMGVAGPHPMFGVENAFPGLKFKRPVVLTHAADGSDRLFVAEQDGKIRV